jgi:hypothetical protein
VTILAPHGVPGGSYGDFSGKTSSVEPVPPGAAFPVGTGVPFVLERPLLPQSTPANLPGLLAWSGVLVKQLISVFGEYGFRLNRVLPADGSESMTGPLPLATFTTSTLPDAADWTGAVIYVSDGSSGARFRGSDGTSWVNLG